MNDELKKLVEQTKPQIYLPDKVKERIEYRTAPIAMPAHYGSGRLHAAYVALPDHFNLTKITDLRANSLNNYMWHLYAFTVDDPQLWLTPVGKILIDSFVLSDRAKKFVIVRQAYMADNQFAIMFAPICFLLTYVFYLTSDITRKQARHASTTLKVLASFTSFCLIFANFILIRHMKLQQMYYDADAKALTRGAFDKESLNELAMKGQKLPIDPELFEGAIEFYSKEIQRNRAIRQLIKRESKAWFSDGSGRFTEEGDFRSSSFSSDPFPSRAIRNIVNWKTNRKSEEHSLIW